MNTELTSNFTGLTRTCFPGLLQSGEIEEAFDLEPPAEPTVHISSTIRVTLERGQTGTTYVWTKEEATLIRDILIDELGDPTPPFVYQPQFPSYPNTSPWIVTNTCGSSNGCSCEIQGSGHTSVC